MNQIHLYKKVLVLEDSPVMQKVLNLMLKSLPGIRWEITSTLQEALGKIQENAKAASHFDLVLTDLNCLGIADDPATATLGGLQLVALLRKDERYPCLSNKIQQIPNVYKRVPILMLSANDCPDLHHQVMGAGLRDMGVSEFLIKSQYLTATDQSKFMGILRQHLGMPAAQSSGGQAHASRASA